jgi:hypothetical protein
VFAGRRPFDTFNGSFSNACAKTTMTEEQALAELEREQFPDVMSESERTHFENLLVLRAYVRGWTGDPLCQPRRPCSPPIARCAASDHVEV